VSRKHNCKHPERGPGNYHLRLAARGVSSAKVRMETAAALAARQRKRKEDTGFPWKVFRASDGE
jgi:hypothetical protein